MILFSLFVLAVTFCYASCDKPHIIYMVADDLGYNDIGWNDPQILTPNLNKLAEEGVILSNLYGMSACSPSRAALFTGRYSSSIGSQHFVFFGHIPHGVPTTLPFLPARLKENGYTTYGVGKWHQGYCNESYVPSAPNRGFDHWYGLYNGGATYHQHTASEWGPKITDVKMLGFDLHEDGQQVTDPRTACVFSSTLFQQKMVSNIQNHDPSVPMFQFSSFQLPHTPRVVPDEYSDRYPDIIDPNRKIYYGQVSYLDDIVGDMVAALKEKGMYEDTLFIFHADNGGDVHTGASNHPFRGNKATFFDGGIKLVGFVSGKGIEKTGYTHDGLFHLTDIHPTLVQGVVGGEVSDNLDGMNVWEALSTGVESPRTEFLITVDTDFADRTDFMGANITAIRVGDWKLMIGIPTISYAFTGFGWYPPLNTEHPVEIEPPEEDTDIFLFNMKDDPYEEHNLASEMPEKVAELRQKLKPYEAEAWTFWDETTDAADPRNFNHFWETGWC